MIWFHHVFFIVNLQGHWGTTSHYAERQGGCRHHQGHRYGGAREVATAMAWYVELLAIAGVMFFVVSPCQMGSSEFLFKIKMNVKNGLLGSSGYPSAPWQTVVNHIQPRRISRVGEPYDSLFDKICESMASSTKNGMASSSFKTVEVIPGRRGNLQVCSGMHISLGEWGPNPDPVFWPQFVVLQFQHHVDHTSSTSSTAQGCGEVSNIGKL